MRFSRTKRMLTAALVLTLASGEAFAHGFRGGGGGFRGGMGGAGMRGGFGGARPGAGGFRGGVPGGFGGSSFGRAPSFSSAGTFNRAGGGFQGYNPYAGGMAARGGGFEPGRPGGIGAGAYAGPRGGVIDLGAAGRGTAGPLGAGAGGDLGAMRAASPGERSFADVGRAGGAIGAGGGVAGGREFAAGGYRDFGVSAARPYGFNPYGASHNGWVHGYWNGHEDAAWGWRGGAWGLGAATGLGWGLTNWGYGSLLYDLGYWPYVNPYVVGPVVSGASYDYSEPIDTTAAPVEDDATTQAVTLFDAARAAFLQGDSSGALQQAEAALAQTPDDTALHQFRALCLFALGRYDEAAEALYAVLSVGPGWDWSTLIGLYPDVATYTTQLRALEASCKADPQSAADRFVLAYHYLTQGHSDSAVGLLKQVVALKPDDRLSADLVAQLSSQGTAAESSQPPPASGPSPADSTPPQGATIAGTWTANPIPGTSVALAIQPDGSFTWDASQGGKSSQFAGKSTFGDGLLTLAQDNGPVLVGRVNWTDADHMTFVISGGNPSDPGLRFSR